MPLIKEIRKLSKEIKEVPKEKKVESIDDEFEEDESDETLHTGRVSFSPIRRTNKTSTLESSDDKQDTFEDRQQNRAPGNEKEGRSAVNFYVAATGNNPYKSNAYTPVGSAESSGKTRDLGERDIGKNRDTRDNNMNNQGNSMERSYAGEQDQGEKKDRKRNLM
ncbi:MAG: hypothetical protein AABX10_03725 [Nanoarchaeota archaeon]